jgi:hypothetical protein
MTLDPAPAEREQIAAVMAAVLSAIRADETIRLPLSDKSDMPDPSDIALLKVGAEPNPFGGSIGPYRYQFEGEDDLLHLFVVRLDASPLTPVEGQAVAALVLGDVPPGLVWFKPGRQTQHFYLGHDVLLGAHDRT